MAQTNANSEMDLSGNPMASMLMPTHPGGGGAAATQDDQELVDLQTQQAAAPTDAGGSLSSAVTAAVQQGQSTDFVKKLFQMLEENRFSSIVRWTDSGDSFMISDTNEFTKEVLPCYFKHSNFSSFVRQLNKYDFHKVKLSQEIRQRYQLENVWEFKHPDFNRFDKSSLENIKRKVPAKKEQTDTVAAANCVPITSYRKLEDRVSFLEKENVFLNSSINNMSVSLNKLNQKYNTLVSNLLTSKDIDMSFSRSIQILSKGLVQLGVQLPAIELPHLDYLADTSDTLSSLNTHNSSSAANPHPAAHPGAHPPVNGQIAANTGPHLNNMGNFNNHSASAINNVPPPTQNNQLSDSHTGSNRRSSQNSLAGGKMMDVDIKQEEEVAEPELKPTPTNSALNPQARLLNRPQGSALHVLLVEDDDVCIQLCRKFLMKYGCTVVVVTDGLSAISAVEQVKFDLVLMDIVMPNLDGASATSVIRSFDKDTPIIAMTGNYQRNDLVTYLNHGMTDILAKPFTKDDLYMILEKHKMDRKLNFTNKSPDDDISSRQAQLAQPQPPIHQHPSMPSLTSQAPTPHVQISAQQSSTQLPQTTVDGQTLVLASQTNSGQSNPESSNTPSAGMTRNPALKSVQPFDNDAVNSSSNNNSNNNNTTPANTANTNNIANIENNGNVSNTNQNYNSDATNNSISNGNPSSNNSEGGNKLVPLGDQLVSSNLPPLNERRITQARLVKKYGNSLLNSASSMSAGQMVQEMELNVANIPNVHDDLLTPTLLESPGLTPDAGMPGDVGDSLSAAAAVEAVTGVTPAGHQAGMSLGNQPPNVTAAASDALNAAEMDISGVNDAEFGDMFKRRRVM